MQPARRTAPPKGGLFGASAAHLLAVSLGQEYDTIVNKQTPALPRSRRPDHAARLAPVLSHPEDLLGEGKLLRLGGRLRDERRRLLLAVGHPVDGGLQPPLEHRLRVEELLVLEREHLADRVVDLRREERGGGREAG